MAFWRLKEYIGIIALVLTLGVMPVTGLAKKNQPFILNYHLNEQFPKEPRLSTRFIIIHTSEAGLESTLNTLAHGKSVGRYRTIGGHAHYAIARDGQVYRVLHHRYRADHAGLSMWDGLEDISSHSLGIELVGYHYDTITPQQYRSLSRLLKILQRLYHVPDKNVLTHSQVSYGKPNSWFRRPHRGRKRCALNFEREKAGLQGAWSYDPDVKSGRLALDRHIQAMFYKRKPGIPGQPGEIIASADIPGKTGTGTEPGAGTEPGETTSPNFAETTGDLSPVPKISNIISLDNTAWSIAGEDYDDSTTLYILPDRQTLRGDQVEKQLGWNRIPTGTQVLLNQPAGLESEKKKGPIFLITNEYTAWSFAGEEFSSPTTYYFLPDGQIRQGNEMADWDSIPGNTRMIMGYRGPFSIRNVIGETPWGIAGRAYNHPDTVYFLPGQEVTTAPTVPTEPIVSTLSPVPTLTTTPTVTTGDQIKDFSNLPRGSKLFLKIPLGD